MLNRFNGLVAAAVLLILAIAAGEAAMGLAPFDPLGLAGAVSMLLMLPILLKFASRRARR